MLIPASGFRLPASGLVSDYFSSDPDIGVFRIESPKFLHGITKAPVMHPEAGSRKPEARADRKPKANMWRTP